MLRQLKRFLGVDRQNNAPDVPAVVDAVAATSSPRDAANACDGAKALIARGRLDEARGLLHEALRLKDDLAEGHYWFAVIHENRGEMEEAFDCYQLAAHHDPQLIAAHAGRARILAITGDLERAANALRQAIELAPFDVQLHLECASLLKSHGDLPGAAGHYQRVIEFEPDSVPAHVNLCHVLNELGSYEAGRRHGERAIELAPDLAEARHNLGLSLLGLGLAAEALIFLKRAFELKPGVPEIQAALGHAYRDLGRIQDALDAYDAALRIDPRFGDAIANRAQAFLLEEDYATGWNEYEKRFAASGTGVRDFGLPRWNGEPLRERTILVHAEQGIGDEMMFASCLPDLIAVAGRVVIECNVRLEPLFRRSFPSAVVHGGKKEDAAEWLGAIERPDFQIPMGGLPRFFRGVAKAFPRRAGYLHADPARTAYWTDYLRQMGLGLTAGLSWRGGIPKTRSHLRSIAPAELAPLLEQTGVTFINLQHGANADELAGYAAPAAVHTIEGLTEDLDELAGMICALDLVITVDNTNVHLAGALGRPLWVLLSASPEWRYGLSGETMPWYSSARLFRRGEDQQWGPIIVRLAAELSALRERTEAQDS